MVAEGILVPTAQQISDRAGIGIRSFFRHFLDMESLFLAADEQSRKGMEALFIGIDRSGALKERIQHVVECRAEGYDTMPMTFARLKRMAGAGTCCIRITSVTNGVCAKT